MFISPAGVRCAWVRHNIETFIKRLSVLEEKAGATGPILTEAQVQALERKKQDDAVSGEIEHTKTKAQHPQTNGICERCHKTILQEFYQTAFRRKLYGSIEELQQDLDQWIEEYNSKRTHHGKMCCGRTPMATFIDGNRL